jgi:hypothetical protein
LGPRELLGGSIKTAITGHNHKRSKMLKGDIKVFHERGLIISLDVRTVCGLSKFIY